MHKTLIFIFLTFFFTGLIAQNKITLNNKGKITSINCLETASYENINGNINVSIITNNGLLLQLNNINEKQFKCGARLSSKLIKLVLIDNKNEITYVSNTSVQVLIKCKKTKDDFELVFSGIVKNNKKIISVTSFLQVKTTPKQYIKSF